MLTDFITVIVTFGSAYFFLTIQSFFYRASLTGPSFKLLCKVFLDDEWMPKAVNQNDTYLQESSYVQQTLLLILEDISASLLTDIPLKVS